MGRANQLKSVHKLHEMKRRIINLKNPFRESPIVLLRDLSLVSRTIEDGRVVGHVVNVNHDRRVILVEVIRSYES